MDRAFSIIIAVNIGILALTALIIGCAGIYKSRTPRDQWDDLMEEVYQKKLEQDGETEKEE